MALWELIDWFEEHKSVIVGVLFLLLMIGGFLFQRFYLESEDTLIGVARVHGEKISLRDLDDYEEYLAKYPKGKYASEAEDVIVQYYSSHELFSSFSKSSNVPYLEQVRDKFPKSNLGFKMQGLIDEKVNEAYNFALAHETIAAWSDYKRNVTEGYWRDANEQIELLNQRWSDEGQAWVIAQNHNDIIHYEEYLKFHPQSSHSRRAEKMVIDLTVAQILNNDYDALPAMEKTKKLYSNLTTINISNDTDYTMSVLFSGPDSKKLVLVSNCTQSILLASGKYAIAARVEDARGIRPFAGHETFTGGEYSETFYIETITIRR